MGLGLPGSLPSYHILYTFCCLFLMANKIVVVVVVETGNPFLLYLE